MYLGGEILSEEEAREVTTEAAAEDQSSLEPGVRFTFQGSFPWLFFGQNALQSLMEL